MIKALPDLKVVVIRMDRVPYMDQSGLYAMENAIMGLQDLNVQVVFTDVHGQPLVIMEKVNLIPNLVERKYCFDNFEQCAAWLEVYVEGGDHEPLLNHKNVKEEDYRILM